MAQLNNWVPNLNSPLGIAVDPTNTFLYEIDSATQSINQIDISTGTIATTIVASGTFTTPISVAVDPTNTFLYVSDITQGTISTVLIASPNTVTTWASGLISPADFVIDSANVNMYVATQDGLSTGTSGTITQIPIATPGSPVTFTSGLVNTIAGLAIDSAGNNLYVANTDGTGNGLINQIDVTGTPGTLVTASWATLASGYPQGIVLDVSNNYLYVAFNSNILQVAVAIPTQIVPWTTNLAYTYRIKFDSNETYMYVSNPVSNTIAKIIMSFTPSSTQYYLCDASANIINTAAQSSIVVNQPSIPVSTTILIDGQSYAGTLYTTSLSPATYYWSQLSPISIDPAKYYLCDQTGNVLTTGSLSPYSKIATVAVNTFTAAPLSINIQGSNLNGNLFSNSDGTTFYWTQQSVIIPPSSGTFYACNSSADNIPFTNSIPFTSGSTLPPSATYPATYSDTAFTAVVQGNPYAGFLYTDTANGLYYWSSSAFIPSPTLFYPCASNGTIISELGGVALLPQIGGQWQGYSWSASSGNQTIDGTPYIGYIYANGSNYYWSQIAPFVPSSTVYYPVNSGKSFVDGSGNNLNAFALTETTLPKDQWYGYQYTELIYGTPTPGYFYLNYSGTKFFWSRIKFIPKPVCFKEDTKILAKKSENEEEQWIEVQDLRKGMLVKTVLHDFVKIDMIGNRNIKNPATQERIKDRLYVCKSEKYPELFEDLIITGCHSILVKEITDEEREELIKEMGKIYVTDEHYRLMAMVDKRAEPYTEEGNYTIWHFALENEGYYANYGIYANGLLVETCSKRMLLEISGMTLVE
jgi:DNA-binding beta-propeller fold protein YncE